MLRVIRGGTLQFLFIFGCVPRCGEKGIGIKKWLYFITLITNFTHYYLFWWVKKQGLGERSHRNEIFALHGPRYSHTISSLVSRPHSRPRCTTSSYTFLCICYVIPYSKSIRLVRLGNCKLFPGLPLFALAKQSTFSQVTRGSEVPPCS